MDAQPANDRIKLHPSWKNHLADEFSKPYMQQLRAFLVQQKRSGKDIFPQPNEWFNALNTTPLDNVKVVILGQDPYPTPGHAHGLCFSVREGVKPPASLKNIYQEMADDINVHNTSGCLENWARQGVLLLNTVLTVERGQPAAHQGKGWEQFTDRVIETVNTQRNHVMFVLWGAHAQKKLPMIDLDKHAFIKSPHPSPMSVHRGFYGSKPFSRINQYLRENGEQPINWDLQQH